MAMDQTPKGSQAELIHQRQSMQSSQNQIYLKKFCSHRSVQSRQKAGKGGHITPTLSSRN